MAEIDRYQRLDKHLHQHMEFELNAKSDGTYLWVSLVCKEIENVPPEQMMEILEGTPGDLESLYHRKCGQLSREDPDAARKYETS